MAAMANLTPPLQVTTVHVTRSNGSGEDGAGEGKGASVPRTSDGSSGSSNESSATTAMATATPMLAAPAPKPRNGGNSDDTTDLVASAGRRMASTDADDSDANVADDEEETPTPITPRHDPNDTGVLSLSCTPPLRRSRSGRNRGGSGTGATNKDRSARYAAGEQKNPDDGAGDQNATDGTAAQSPDDGSQRSPPHHSSFLHRVAKAISHDSQDSASPTKRSSRSESPSKWNHIGLRSSARRGTGGTHSRRPKQQQFHNSSGRRRNALFPASFLPSSSGRKILPHNSMHSLTSEESFRGSATDSVDHLIVNDDHLQVFLPAKTFPYFVVWHLSYKTHLWESALSAIVIYQAVTIPLLVSFHYRMHLDFAINTVIYTMLVLDFLRRFLTTHIKLDFDASTNTVGKEPPDTARYYIRQWWFWIDLACCAPVEFFKLQGPLAWMYLLLVVRLGKVIHSINLMQAGSARLLRLIGMIMLVMHWITCAWNGIGEEWMCTAIENCQQGDKVELASTTEYYGLALHQTCMSLFASGAAVTPREQFFFAFCTICGAVLGASVFGSVAVLLSTMDEEQNHYNNFTMQVDRRMKHMRFPAHLAGRVRKYHKATWATSRTCGGVDEEAMFSHLPRSLLGDIKLHNCKKLVLSMKIFRTVSEIVVEEIVLRLKKQVFLEGDVVMRQGERGSWMAFIESGKVAITSGTNIVRVLNRNSYFGELGMLYGMKRTASAMSIMWLSIYVLNRSDWREIKHMYRDELQDLEKELRNYIRSRRYIMQHRRVSADGGTGSDTATSHGGGVSGASLARKSASGRGSSFDSDEDDSMPEDLENSLVHADVSLAKLLWRKAAIPVLMNARAKKRASDDDKPSAAESDTAAPTARSGSGAALSSELHVDDGGGAVTTDEDEAMSDGILLTRRQHRGTPFSRRAAQRALRQQGSSARLVEDSDDSPSDTRGVAEQRRQFQRHGRNDSGEPISERSARALIDATRRSSGGEEPQRMTTAAHRALAIMEQAAGVDVHPLGHLGRSGQPNPMHAESAAVKREIKLQRATYRLMHRMSLEKRPANHKSTHVASGGGGAGATSACELPPVTPPPQTLAQLPATSVSAGSNHSPASLSRYTSPSPPPDSQADDIGSLDSSDEQNSVADNLSEASQDDIQHGNETATDLEAVDESDAEVSDLGGADAGSQPQPQSSSRQQQASEDSPTRTAPLSSAHVKADLFGRFMT